MVHSQYWTVTKIALEYPAVAPSQGDPVTIILQVQSLHVLQQVIGRGDVEVG